VGDILVVGLNDDSAVRRLKGEGRPLQSQMERAEIVAAVRWVDLVTIFSGDRADDILRALRPDVHAKGTDYTPDAIPEAGTVRDIGASIAIVGDPKNHATERIISRIRETGEGP
jgi:rfaE bifunctional protein nucleotidyltransferase chain/domain